MTEITTIEKCTECDKEEDYDMPMGMCTHCEKIYYEKDEVYV